MEITGKAVLILQEKNPETIQGIIIPATAQLLNSIGEVIDCGGGCEDVKKGDRVIYSPKSGSIMQRDGVDYHFVSESDIQYIYGKDS